MNAHIGTAPRIRQRTLAEAIRPVAPPFDYVDVFTMTATAAREASPESWARACVEDAAGAAGQVVWRGILGLRLDARRSPDRVGGWAIADRGDDWIRLEARSWCMTAHILVHVTDDEVTIATFVGYDRPPASLIWPPVAAVHRRAMPRLMRGAARFVTASSR